MASSGPGPGALSIRLVPRSERRSLGRGASVVLAVRSGGVWLGAGHTPSPTVSHLLSAMDTKGCSSYSESPPPHPGRSTSPFTGSAPPLSDCAHARASGLHLFPWQRVPYQSHNYPFLWVGLSLRSRQPRIPLETCTLSPSLPPQTMTVRPGIKNCFGTRAETESRLLVGILVPR